VTDFRGLQASVRGAVLLPGSAEYEEARHPWNGTVDRRPAAVVKCERAADVQAVVNFGRENGKTISVRGGGHHVGGDAVAGAIVADLSPMNSVEVDVTTGIVRVEGGAKLGDIDGATQHHGLAVPLGAVADTGVAGLTLGGGIGWLRRKYGYTADNLLAAEVVTADGKLIRASKTENRDLLWALRGAGWGLGAVASFEFQAYPVGPEVFLTFTAYSARDARGVMRAFGDFMAAAREEIAPLAVGGTFPSKEPYPAEVWGQQFLAIAGPYVGEVGEGEKAMAPLREFATPLLDMSGRLPYVEVQKMFDEDYPQGKRHYWKSAFLAGLDDDAVATFLDFAARRPSPETTIELMPAGGAMSLAIDSPLAHREAPYVAFIESNWEHGADDGPNIAWAREAAAALSRFSTGGSNLNFEDLDDEKAAAAARGKNQERLAEIKRKYDPRGVFYARKSLFS
jgi:FAD/FMN-containing dehydrogenase